MQTNKLAVCNMDLFGKGVRHFWISELSGLIERFPILEFPHKQVFYMLLIIEFSEGEISIDNNKIRLDGAKAIIITPHCINSIKISHKAKGTIICFTEEFFSLRYNSNILSQFNFLHREAKPYIKLSEQNRNRLNALIKFLNEEYLFRKKESTNVLRSYLNIILFELERLYNPLGFNIKKDIKKEKILQFENLIDHHYKTQKLPSEYAVLLNVTPNYLNKLCKDEIGMTAGNLIRKRITIEAQRLLYHTNDTVNEIAYALGFENASYFNTFFKKQTVITPDQYRKKMIEN